MIRTHNAWIARANELRGGNSDDALAEGWRPLSEEACLHADFDGSFPFVADGAGGPDPSGAGVPYGQRILAVAIHHKIRRLEEEVDLLHLKVRNLYCVLCYRRDHLREVHAHAVTSGRYGRAILASGELANTDVLIEQWRNYFENWQCFNMDPDAFPAAIDDDDAWDSTHDNA